MSGRRRDDLLEFLRSVARPGSRVADLADDANLIRAGVIDSFAVIQIILYLEERFNLDLRAADVDPADLGTIGGILATIAGTGK